MTLQRRPTCKTRCVEEFNQLRRKPPYSGNPARR